MLTTAIALERPVTTPCTVSVAVIVCEPPVTSVAVKVPMPPLKVWFAGTVPEASLVEKPTVPV